MTSSNENDSTPVVPAATASTHTDHRPSQAGADQSENGERNSREDRGPRHPRRAGTGKHPFNKKRPFNKDKQRRESRDGDQQNGPRESGGNHGSKFAPNPAEAEALFASVVSGEFDAALDAPEVVETNSNGLKSVSYGNIVGLLIEAIKEQQVRIEELERKLNA